MTSSRKIECMAAVWLARRDAGDWDEHEQSQFDIWLAASTRHRVAYLRLDAAWRQSDRLRALGAGVTGGTVPARRSWSLSAFIDRPDSSATRSDNSKLPDRQAASTRHTTMAQWRRVWLSAAMGALATAIMLIAIWQRYPAVQHGVYRTAVGALQSVALADGSEATLNSDSDIVVNLSRRERDIDLRRGEAFFKVAKNPQRPFVVSAGAHRVIAVGTRFSVRRDGDHMRVIVTEGMVRLESDPAAASQHQATTLLPAGSVAEVDNADLLVRQIGTDRAEQLLNWRDGFVTFDDTPLAAAVTEFNRYNRLKIVIADPSVAAMRVGGNFRWSNTQAFVRLLEQGFALQAAQDGDTIMLQRRRSAPAQHSAPARR
ncbi:MAG: FecR family protein [Rudaea sp.]